LYCPETAIRTTFPQQGENVGFTEAILLTIRPGELEYCQPFAEAFLRPGFDPGSWNNRSTSPYVNFVATGSEELSQFVQHGQGSYAQVRCYSLRTDDFASVRAPLAGGELLTPPMQFDGNRLLLNYSTSGAGSVRVEIQDAGGAPVPGYAMDDAIRHVGDASGLEVRWKSGGDISGLKGRSIRLRVIMHDADLFSLS